MAVRPTAFFRSQREQKMRGAFISLGILLTLIGCNRESPSVALVVAGDVNLGGSVPATVTRLNTDFSHCFERVSKHLQKADIAFFNLECCISSRGEDLQKEHSFRAPPLAAAGVRDGGIDIVSIANNHSLDFGPEAYEDTATLLREEGVQAVGMAFGPDNRQEPVIMEVKGQKIGFLAYSVTYPKKFLQFDPRPAQSDWSRIGEDVAALAGKSDFMVISMHWGDAHGTVRPAQRQLGRFMIDQGVDVVVGHGPHVLQEHEFYGDGLILFSLGNFVFGPDYDKRTGISTLVRVTLTKGSPVTAEALPIQIEGTRPVPTADTFSPLERDAPPPWPQS